MTRQQIVSAQEMKQLDQLTMKEQGISSYDLMRRAGKRIFEHLLNEGHGNLDERLLVVAGSGNNGGDAMVVAYHLLELGLHVDIVIVGSQSSQSEESKRILKELEAIDASILRVSSEADLSEFETVLEHATIVLDGLFGIGLSRDVEGLHHNVITRINASYATTISIDIPSGLNADNGCVMGVAIHADHTIVIQNFKQGNLLNDAMDHSGEMTLLDVGILQMIFPDEQTLLPLSYLNNKIPKRPRNSYKYMFGDVMTIGGSKGMMGAPLLCACAALRSGSGLSRLLYHEKYLAHVHNPYPDVMVDTYGGIEEIPQMVRKLDAIVFGPGLGRNDDYNLEVLQYLLSTDIPLVVDADGIFYLKQLLKDYSERPNIIITPHYKEMANFLGVSTNDVRKEPILYARNIAHKYNLTVVLKGTCTIITDNEQTFFSNHGNTGLATAGTGDVLSGIIGSLLGRSMDPLEAAKLGVLIHSFAARLTRDVHGEESMIASDLISALPEVLKRV